MKQIKINQYEYTWWQPSRVRYKPEERFYKVTDHLWAGVYPGDIIPRVETRKLNFLLKHGVNCFINLMEPRETNWGGQRFKWYYDKLFEMAARKKMHVSLHNFPIKDMDKPTKKQMVVILDAIDAAIADGRTVYVHCWGGHGRTGTVIGCWLARHGYAKGRGVIEMLDCLRWEDPTGMPSPQTVEQRRMIVKWERGC
jgi:hypothetical protein